MTRWVEAVALKSYAVLWYAVKPVLSTVLLAVRAHRPLRARWNPPATDIPSDAIWVHACSVGEVSVARPLIAAIQARLPSARIFLTASTRTGTAHAAAILPTLARTWCPFDHPAAVRRFLDATRPRAWRHNECRIVGQAPFRPGLGPIVGATPDGFFQFRRMAGQVGQAQRGRPFLPGSLAGRGQLPDQLVQCRLV